ncbi:rod shape-determining protein MreD [Psychromarinibacter sp. S121]|uniref:rod shape-determining protein MreD n=1 Tax=Psychromarinibacter sp. S121 TaxID=3415127 RepID=UPI003C7DD6A3
MDRNRATVRWLYGALYAGLALFLMLMHILPTDLGPDGYPGPDLLLCITLAWVLRRPQYVPTLLIAAVFLMTDFLYMRPPGLWTALIVVAVETLRSREATLREQPLMVEIVTVAVILAIIHIGYWLLLLLFAVPQARFGLLLLEMIATMVTYPMIVVLARVVFKVQKINPADFDATRAAK